MPVTVTALMTGLQLIELITKNMQRFSQGEIDEAQLAALWKAMGIDLTQTNAAWEAALAARGANETPT